MAGTAKHPIYQFTIIPALHAATLNQVDFTTGGTYAASDIANLKLWSSDSDDINSATQVGSTLTSSLGAGAHSFATLAHSMTSSVVEYFWITADIPVTATQLNTINVSALTTANLTFADGSKIGIAYAGEDQTIDGTLPVELSSFTAAINVQNFVNLMWTTQSETGVSGFYIYRGSSDQISQAELISPMIPATNSSQQHSYSFTDDQLYNAGLYYYWLQNVDLDGSNDFHGPVMVNYTISGGTEGIPVIPEATELKGIFPNPFNPTAQISYYLKDAATVNIRIFNSRGQIIRSFNNAAGTIGHHRIVWDGKDESGYSCSTGLYLVRMYAGKDVFTQKAMLVK